MELPLLVGSGAADFAATSNATTTDHEDVAVGGCRAIWTAAIHVALSFLYGSVIHMYLCFLSSYLAFYFNICVFIFVRQFVLASMIMSWCINSFATCAFW